MHGQLPPRVLVVTASDARFACLLRGMVASIAPFLARPGVSLACFDTGLEPDDLAWLRRLGTRVAAPGGHFGIDAAAHRPALLSFLARPFLPDYFPGHDIYLWIDSDVWLQDPAVLDAYVAGARDSGMAITHENEPAYRFQPRLFGWTAKHFLLGYGIGHGAWLLSRPHVNAGFFAIHADAPHWRVWAARYERAIRRTGRLVPHDQFALNQALYADSEELPRLPARVLHPGHNWICDRGVPMWHDEGGVFCMPRPPYRPIGALHLAGPAKHTAYRIRRTGGGSFTTLLVHGATADRPVGGAAVLPA
jgi:hypothetical protein